MTCAALYAGASLTRSLAGVHNEVSASDFRPESRSAHAGLRLSAFRGCVPLHRARARLARQSRAILVHAGARGAALLRIQTAALARVDPGARARGRRPGAL